MRTTLLPVLAAVLAVGATSVAAAAAAPSRGEIHLQRAGDGRIVLTDRPSPTAVTERTWQVEREDPDTARQRAIDVRREAEAVSERIQRRLDAQQRASAELEQSRLARRDRDLAVQLARERAEADAAPLVVAPFGWQPGWRRGAVWTEGQPPRRHPAPPWRDARPTPRGSASPESR